MIDYMAHGRWHVGPPELDGVFYEGGSTLHNGGYGAACCQTFVHQTQVAEIYSALSELSYRNLMPDQSRAAVVLLLSMMLPESIYMF